MRVLRSGLNARSTWRFNARNTSDARMHDMVGGIARSHELAPTQ
jgi:hypothetical protein